MESTVIMATTETATPSPALGGATTGNSKRCNAYTCICCRIGLRICSGTDAKSAMYTWMMMNGSCARSSGNRERSHNGIDTKGGNKYANPHEQRVC